MEFAERYVAKHRYDRAYCEERISGSLTQYRNRQGWQDVQLGKDMIFSHRNTYYTKKTFSEGLHVHDYYELLIYVTGDVEFLNEDRLIRADPLTAVWNAPGQMHTSRLVRASQYERYVMYFSDSFFQLDGRDTHVTDFMKDPHGEFFIRHSPQKAEEILQLLRKADDAIHADLPFSELLLKACIVELFALLNTESQTAHTPERREDGIKDAMMEVKQYIDRNYASISSVSGIAAHFFYSREHLSRRFSETFNIPIYQYLSKRRVTETLPLLRRMSVAEAAFAVGFHSQSAYIAAFRENMGCLPSEYKKRLP